MPDENSKNENNDNNIDFNSSMTDLMTSLMVIFILLLVVLFNNIGEKGEKVRDKMVDDFTIKSSNSKSSEKLKIEKDDQDPLSWIVNIDEEHGLKFESNKSEIMPQSKLSLRKTYLDILDFVCSPENKQYIDSIQIIGYTDENPVIADPQFGNLSLSQDRALSVLKYGLYLVGTDTPKGMCLKEFASINGRGDAELKKTQEESRRVEIKIRVKSYEQYKRLKKDYTKSNVQQKRKNQRNKR